VKPLTRRVFVTGGAGFIGRAVVRHLRGRDDAVTAIVRDPARATSIRDLGVRLVQGDLASTKSIRDAMRWCDAVIHLAASYRVGITPAERRQCMRPTWYWASHGKATAELGYNPRPLRQGAIDAFGRPAT
jgi:nucleoside-diphosphate-sugar epimerase